MSFVLYLLKGKTLQSCDTVLRSFELMMDEEMDTEGDLNYSEEVAMDSENATTSCAL